MTTYGNVLQALADPTRRAIFERLRRGELAVCDLAEGLPVSRPAVSQHLSVLRKAGLVNERRDGVRRLYRLERRGLQALRVYVESFWDDVLESFKSEAEAQHQKTKERGDDSIRSQE